MNTNTKIVSIILFALNKIIKDHNWQPFDDLVLNSKSHPGQNEYLTNSRYKENLLHAGNGFGKTALFARKHLYYILKHFANKKYRTLNVAITQDQSQLVQDEIISLIENSPLLSSFLINKNSVVKFPNALIRYNNGAITEFKTTKKKGESIEGKEYGYISADELALETHLEFIREKILLPRMRKYVDSQIDYGATPKGYTAFYRVMNTIKQAGGYIRGGSAYENPYIDHKLLDYFVRTWSKAKVDQVIFGKFIDTSEMMFASRIEKLFDNDLEFEEATRGGHYIEGWDLARGRKKTADQTVGLRLLKEINKYRITKYWAFQLPWTEKERENIMKATGVKERSSIEREIRQAQSESHSKAYLDSTGVGDTLYGMVQDIASPVDFRGGNKDIILDNLQAVIDSDILHSPFIPALADEMTTYVRQDTNLPTDHLMALAVACSSIKIVKPQVARVVPAQLFNHR